MTQIANVLAVTAVVVGLWMLLSIVNREGRGAYRRDKNTYAGT